MGQDAFEHECMPTSVSHESFTNRCKEKKGERNKNENQILSKRYCCVLCSDSVDSVDGDSVELVQECVGGHDTRFSAGSSG